eukprot:TRINITY_DN3739_c0_g1_i6.p1 TRINITY_DN3739_c0_g1~~TRINITY_DN3739_c0_g1_i6.p1  ORF type:complete len:313 (-),score=60.26 TRINITY_DN3739_c0_g1_i6:255-1193(-)
MNVSLSFKNPSHAQLFELHRHETALSDFKARMLTLFITALLVVVQMILRYVILSDTKFSPNQVILRMVTSLLGMLFLMLLYHLTIRVSFLRNHIDRIFNIVLFIGGLATVYIFLAQLRQLMDADSVNTDFLVSNFFFTMSYVVLSLSLFTNYLYAIAYLLVFYIGSHLVVIANTYDFYWLDVLRIVVASLTISVIIYLREKRSREIHLKMIHAIEDEGRWRSLVRHLSDGIIAFDENFKIVYTNHAVASLLEVPSTLDHLSLETLLLAKISEINNLCPLGNFDPIAEIQTRPETLPEVSVFLFLFLLIHSHT